MTSAAVPDAEQKFSQLLRNLREARSALLAFSGGVDSSFLLKAMQLAKMEFLAVTAVSETTPAADLEAAQTLASLLAAPHLMIRTSELSNEAFAVNPPDRCFHCKNELFSKLHEVRHERQFGHLFDGSTADDLRDYRPGRRAGALHGVRSPLAEAALSKDEIRALSRAAGLPNWHRPASPCLSSRIPYGQRITVEDLRRIAAAEQIIKDAGIEEVRVRVQGTTARIEVNPADMHRLIEEPLRTRIANAFRQLGFAFVSVDLEGFRSGSMNRLLNG